MPFHRAATPSCTQILPDGEDYFGEGDSVDGACMVLREILHDSDVDGGNDRSNVDGDDRS